MGNIQTQEFIDEFEITIGGELETWYMYFVDFNRSPDGNYLTDRKDLSPTYPLPIQGNEEIGVKIEGAGRSTPLKPVYTPQVDQEHNKAVQVQKRLITFLNQPHEEAEKRITQSTFRIDIEGHETKIFNVPAKSILKNKLFGGTEFIYDPLPDETHIVSSQTLIPTFLRTIKQGIRRSQEAFQSNFVQCTVRSPPIFPNLYKTYFDPSRNLLVFSLLGGILDNILVPGDFNQIPFVPQVTFGINVYRLVDFIRILPNINAVKIYSEADNVMKRILSTLSQSTEDKDGFKKYIKSPGEKKKIIDFIFLCLYSFYDTPKASKDECDLKFRFLLRDVFRYFFKFYRSEIVDKIRANIEGGKDGAKGKFIIKVLTTSQEQSKQTQKLQRVNLFGIRGDKVFVEWRRFTVMPRELIEGNTSPQTFQIYNPYGWKSPAISGLMCELITEDGNMVG